MTVNNANLSFGAMSKRTKTTLIVLHHVAGSGSVEQIHEYHKSVKGWSGFGYHFYVRRDGSVWQGRPIDAVGAHTLGYNAESVGVCFEGNFENEQMSEMQRRSGGELVGYIRGIYPSVTAVKGHGELRNTACPGKNFPLSEISSGPAQSNGAQPQQNRVKLFQVAAIADGFKLPKYGADGKWGSETEGVAKRAVCKRRLFYRYKNLTRIVQGAVGVEVDGKFGAKTHAAVIAYQRANGLVTDGEWGINCWRNWMGV